MLALLSILLISSLCLAYGEEDETFRPHVSSPIGEIFGKRIEVLGKEVDAFLGIPYAKPPVGELRFKRPVPSDPLTEVYNATKFALHCTQLMLPIESPWLPQGKNGEDCLYLNIWVPTPNETSYSPKAVMVWIYGGSFLFGSAGIEVYDGAAMAVKGDVVIVSMNYRVGALGFLNLGIEGAAGNMGLYDQHLALSWIRKNIGYFGGNDKKITLFGESAGSISVSLHLTTPISQPLFDRAILQSGTTYQPWIITTEKKSLELAKQLQKHTGCENSTSEAILECLMKIKTKFITRAETKMLANFNFFLPRIGDDIIPIDPYSLIDIKHFSEKDIMIGNTKNEGAILLLLISPMVFLNEKKSNLNISQAKNFIVELFNKHTAVEEISRIVDIYYNDVESDTDFDKIRTRLHTIVGDFLFNCPSVYLANQYSSTRNKVYFYLYTHEYDPMSLFPYWINATHFDEVPYVFGYPLTSKSNYSEEDKTFSENLISLWTSFAKTGKPQSPVHYYWPIYEESNPVAMELNSEKTSIKMASGFEICTHVWGPLYFQSPYRKTSTPDWYHPL